MSERKNLFDRAHFPRSGGASAISIWPDERNDSLFFQLRKQKEGGDWDRITISLDAAEVALLYITLKKWLMNR